MPDDRNVTNPLNIKYKLKIEMGLSVRIFFVGDDDTLERFPFARYERMLNCDPKEHHIEYAGKRVRCILAVVDLANRIPVSILRNGVFLSEF